MNGREESMSAEETAHGKDLKQEASTGGMGRTIQCCPRAESVVNHDLHICKYMQIIYIYINMHIYNY